MVGLRVNRGLRFACVPNNCWRTQPAGNKPSVAKENNRLHRAKTPCRIGLGDHNVALTENPSSALGRTIPRRRRTRSRLPLELHHENCESIRTTRRRCTFTRARTTYLLCLAGNAIMRTLAGAQEFGPGTVIRIAREASHSTENPGREPLMLVEVRHPETTTT